MSKKNYILFCCLLLGGLVAHTQSATQRTLQAKRTTQKVKVDGLITDEAWKDAAVLDSLIEFKPKVGDKEDPANRTIAYLMYDDAGIYFGGYCYERSKDSIASELVGRDGFGTNDYIGLILDTYNDRINGFEYFVTPLNEQWDSKINEAVGDNGDSEDFSWNGVWQSGAVIHNDGWSFEMFIPYSAIRFGKKEVQNWGLNITRRRRKTEEQFTWNPISPNVNGFLTQEGTWTNITGIKPPLRLQFSPYFSNVVSHFPNHNPDVKDWKNSINGGMDVKYGINQAFTLDATLIPDFGQVQSDNRVLNLTPFEVKYTENRPFFTEGTELFGKGDLFYSRRIGKDAAFIHDANTTDEDNITKVPRESKIINATKISGRTAKGLGVGVFNAITQPRYYTIENATTKETRKQLMEPLTNYSIIVLDQTLKHNSSVSLINTNVMRSGADYDANVTAGLFRFNNKTNKWGINGKLAYSHLNGLQTNKKPYTGYSHSFSFGKTSGRFTFNVEQELTNKNFDNNDLGYLTVTNFIDHNVYAGYNWIKPTKWYNRIYLNYNFNYSRRLVSPTAFQGINTNVNANAQLKNLWFIGALIGYEPKGNNFFEPREEGRVFKGWSNYFYDVWVQTNEAKKYALYIEWFSIDRSLFNSKRNMFSLQNRYRFNNKLSISHSLNLEPQKRNVGYADKDERTDDIIFGKRDIALVENLMNVKYSFNNRMNVNTRIRHYWSKVTYSKYFTLMQDGGLADNNTYIGDASKNYNIFNIDMVYTWQFAPGSFLNLIWKNEAETFNQITREDYSKNFRNTMRADDANNFTIKVIYFLDYLDIKKWRKGK